MEKSENGGGVWPGHSSEERGGVRATTRRVSGRARSRQDGAGGAWAALGERGKWAGPTETVLGCGGKLIRSQNFKRV
jgi:hypothetical protein